MNDHHQHSHEKISDDNSAITAKMHGQTITLEREILGKNQLLAERNRAWFAEKNILALNLVSSPRSGKTTLLERTLNDLKNEYEISVIEGDQETIYDAERIRATGCKAVQINTGTGCHLEADNAGERFAKPRSAADFPDVHRKCRQSRLSGNVRPRRKRAKVATLSVTEGEDKSLKYPNMFRASKLMMLNKIDSATVSQIRCRKMSRVCV